MLAGAIVDIISGAPDDIISAAMRKLNNWLRTYMEYTSGFEAPDKFHFWTGVWTIAAALRKKCYFDMGGFTWSPNFYIIFVAPPGIVTKSTTASFGAKLLEHIPGINFGPNVITWQALIQALSEVSEAVMMPDGLYHTHSCLSFYSSELGTLLNLQDRAMVDALTDLWDGHHESFVKKTKIDVNTTGAPWLNIIACTTPKWIADNAPRHIIGGGFTSRCVWVYAERKRKLVPYPKLSSGDSLSLSSPLVHDLECIASMKGEFTLTPEAIAYGEEWYRKHWETAPLSMPGDEYSGYIGRKQCHVHKLAMVLSASERDDRVITVSHLDSAVQITSEIESEIPKIFGLVHADPMADRVLRLIELVAKLGRVSKRNLYRMMIAQFQSYEEFDRAVTSAISADFVESVLERDQQILVSRKPNG